MHRPHLHATLEAGTLTTGGHGAPLGQWALDASGATPRLAWRAGPHDAAHLLAALDAALMEHPAVLLDHAAPDELLEAGAARPTPDGLLVLRECFWQFAPRWHGRTAVPWTQRLVMSQSRRHPERPPKPEGVVYRRHIPWLGGVLSLRAIDLEPDLPAFNRWMNDPFVSRFWDEAGDMAAHRAYLQRLAADPHTSTLAMCLDGKAFGYAEAYWVKEDRLAPFCEAGDYDRGWHVLVGEPSCRGRAFASAWLPSLAHHLFLEDVRTQRIFVEPRADNARMLRNLGMNGYALLKTFDFPHKRAMLSMLLRERFFGEALWMPRHNQENPCKSTT